MSFMEKLDVVIQGPYTDFTDYIVDSYLDIPFVNNIIVSCWKDDKESKYKQRVKFVRNDYPQSPGTDNKNLQIFSSLNGLKSCETKFSIKTRSDQRFSYDSMIKMYDFFLSENNKKISYEYDPERPYNRILVAGFYPDLLFAVRDHLYWGNTKDLIELFDIPLEQNSLVDIIKVPKEKMKNYLQYFTRTETYIGAHYCANFNEEVNRLLLLPKEHLYDNAIYWYYSKEISDIITPSVFKSFPKDFVTVEWNKYGNLEFHFHGFSFWNEDGF